MNTALALAATGVSSDPARVTHVRARALVLGLDLVAVHERHDRDRRRAGIAAVGGMDDRERLLVGVRAEGVPPGAMKGPAAEGRRPGRARGERVPGHFWDGVERPADGHELGPPRGFTHGTEDRRTVRLRIEREGHGRRIAPDRGDGCGRNLRTAAPGTGRRTGILPIVNDARPSVRPMDADPASRLSPYWSWPTIRRAAPTLLLVFLGSRVILVVVAVLLEAVLPVSYRGLTFSNAPVVGTLTGEDAVYYLGIARDGYHALPIHDSFYDWVYFPAFPLLTKLAGTVMDIGVAGLVVANLAALASMFFVYRLGLEVMDHREALLATALVATAPGAIALGLPYSDSLLLASVAGSFVAIRARRPWLAAGAYALATLTRPPGILFGLPIAVGLWKSHRSWRSLLPLLAGPLALVLFCVYQGLVLGDPLAWVHAQGAWNLAPAVTSVTGNGGSAEGSTVVLVVLLVLGLLVYTSLLPALLRGVPLDQGLVAVVAFATVFLSGRLQSDLRYLAIGWPFAWVVVTRLGGIRRDMSVLVAGGVFVLFAFLNLSQALAP